MQFVEVVVNVPIRPSFGRKDPPPPTDPATVDVGEQEQTRTFHYHLPVELEGRVQPGHLVWVPFGPQRLKGVVIALSGSAPLQTRAVERLARSEPVLTPLQIALAVWLADRYVAPLSEAVKLFVPPGMMGKDDERGVRAKREYQAALAISPDEIDRRLVAMRKDSPRTVVLEWFLAHPASTVDRQALMAACDLKSPSSLQTLARHGLLHEGEEGWQLAVSPEEAGAYLEELYGTEKYRRVLDCLAAADTPYWKSDLQAAMAAVEPGARLPISLLRDLQTAGLIHLEERIRFRDPLADRTFAETTAPILTQEQQRVWEQVAARAFPAAGMAGGHFLLHGVTGSGKTEIYLRAIQETLARGRQAIVLVPEIALTPQTVARFAGRFPGAVTVIHSGLSAGERYDVWRHIRDGSFDIVVGPRSALFAPLQHLGLIVVDEEHEASDKQDAEAWGSFKVFYDARALARHMAELSGSALIYGSATPSLDTYYLAEQGELTLLEMPRRVLGHRANPATATKADAQDAAAASTLEPVYAELPPVEVVDMRQELRAGNRSIFSRSLTAELHATLGAGEQAILFLNRRGTATFVMCRDCGEVLECKRCEVPLTYHERANVLICHHCNRRYPIPERCPACESKRIKYFGSGTQRIEEYVRQIAPHAQLIRWDADSVTRKGRHEEILARFARGDANVMVGTQMIAKGLDLPMVTLVGVIAADVGLYLPDFRSAERTFQLLTQVAGRAGRSARGGRVVIQSYTPEHYAVQAAAAHDYAQFYTREMTFRHEHQYPPVRRLARLIYWNKQSAKAQQESETMAAVLRHRLAQLGLAGEAIGVLGPAPAFFSRQRGYYRWQILLRAPDPALVLRDVDIPFGWRIDVDPVSVL